MSNWKNLFGLSLIVVIVFGVLLSRTEAEDSAITRVDRPDLPATPYNYSDIDLPIHLAFIINNIPADNLITDEGATLGRVLFYDKRLSGNNTTSCASCHLQSLSFADVGATSVGFAGARTTRNSMGLANNRYFQSGDYFWDNRVDSLEELVLLPITDHIEMGSDMPSLLTELSAESYYQDLFDDVFGSAEITEERISLALSQFVRSMVSYQSKYDIEFSNGFAGFTASEERGRRLFQIEAQCGICHNTDAQILLSPRNNGLDLIYRDNGVGTITGSQYDMGLFKPPSLRNIELSAPYMHDGRFDTLEDVIDHYSTGVQNHPNLDAFIPPNGFNFSNTQKTDLLNFLLTLTDDTFTTDPKFSDPFVEVPTAVQIQQISVVKTNKLMVLTIIVLALATFSLTIRRKNR